MRRLNKTYPYQKQLKNRSSKDNGWLCGVGTKSILKCVSGEQLKTWCLQEVNGAEAESERRQKRAGKKKSK